MTLHNKVVWITGASSGIGEALAYEVAQRGARLVLSARRAERLEEVRAACASPEAHFVAPLDLEDHATLEEAARQVLDRAGHVDVLVNNGGISQRSLVKDTQVEVVRRLMEVNFLGTVALTKAVLPSMLARRSGHIVVVSSLVGKFSTPYRSAYAASKHALHAYFDALRTEVENDGIGVTIVCPGFVRTNVSMNALSGDGTPRNTMDETIANGMPADECARRIVRAVEKEKEEAYIADWRKVGVYAKRYWPWLFNRLIGKVPVT